MNILFAFTTFNVANAGWLFGPGSGSGSGDGGGDYYVQNSLDYAKSQTDWNWNALKSNIQSQLGHNQPEIDLLWPGNGFDQAAYAGNYAVLKYLESHGVLKVGRIMGGSGGATAALLALASEETGVDAARLMTESFGVQSDQWGTTAELDGEYLARITDWSGGLTGTITEDLYVAVLSGNYKQYVVHNLQNPTQASQAVLGSGGTHYTISIPGIHCLGETFDGGIMSAFPTNQRATIYVAAWYGNALGCDRSCIETNFKKGVDQTIAMLMSSNLVSSDVGSWSGCSIGDCSGMVLSKSGSGADLENLSYQHLNGGHPFRSEPVQASANTWVDAASYCSGGWGRRRSAKGPNFPLSLLEAAVDEPQEETAGL